MKIIKAGARHFLDMGWLKTYWLFSFDSYYDPQNMNFGNLRVFNDDIVAPGTGFPPHPHANMEIVTMVLEGELTHEDNAGNKGNIFPGDVQHMSAGRGVIHSEFNRGKTPTHLYQVWFEPRKRDIAPAYRQQVFSGKGDKNGLLAVASGDDIEGAIPLEADATMYLGNLEAAVSIVYNIQESRGIFVYVTQGTLEINGDALSPGDQARISQKGEISLSAKEAVRFVLIETAIAS